MSHNADAFYECGGRNQWKFVMRIVNILMRIVKFVIRIVNFVRRIVNFVMRIFYL